MCRANSTGRCADCRSTAGSRVRSPPPAQRAASWLQSSRLHHPEHAILLTFACAQMTWRIRVIPDFPIIEIVFADAVTSDELGHAFHATVELATEHEVSLFLADCTTLTGGHSVFDLYGIADALSSFQFHRKFAEAVLLPTLGLSAADVRFWETTCRNRGHNVRVFRECGAVIS
jgi:hypothetical protein